MSTEDDLDTVERVAEAIWNAVEGNISGVPWDSPVVHGGLRADKYRCIARAAIAEMPRPERDDTPTDREELGQMVRDVWVGYCLETGDTKPSHIAPWSELSEWDKEADRRIGEALAAMPCPPPDEVLDAVAEAIARSDPEDTLFRASDDTYVEWEHLSPGEQAEIIQGWNPQAIAAIAAMPRPAPEPSLEEAHALMARGYALWIDCTSSGMVRVRTVNPDGVTIGLEVADIIEAAIRAAVANAREDAP